MGITKGGCKKVGFWRDTGAMFDFFSGYPDPREPTPHPQMDATQRIRVAQYLDGGEVSDRWFGYSYCRFDCGIPNSEMGSLDKTDGAYIWPEGLPHYVRVHQVNLPAEFVDHVLHKMGLGEND